jgi:long-chain acyl-CoA synthetase
MDMSLIDVYACPHTGEYIEVEKVENVLMSARLVAQLFVHGDSNEDSLVAIVVPDIDTLRPHLLDVFKNEDIATMSLKDLCELYYPVIKQSIMFEFTELAAKCNLKGYEMVKNIFLDGEMWVNVGASSILTPTMKLKRNLAKEKYAKDIKKLYSELRMNVKAKL